MPRSSSFSRAFCSSKKTSGERSEPLVRAFALPAASQPLPGGSAFFRRIPSRSDLATSCWKVRCRLVRAVHEDDGSLVTICGHTCCSCARKPPRFCLECRSIAFAHPCADLLAAFSCPRSRCYPLSYRPPPLRLCCADGISSAQRTSSVMSLHRQKLHEEHAREGAREASPKRIDLAKEMVGLHERRST